MACSRARGGADYQTAVVLFGLILALMNFSFYSALARIPLGIAVTVEFIGPLSVAVVGSRRALDVLWAVLAVGGILLFAPLGVLGAVPLDPLGLLLALVAGACWAIYILLTARVGRAFPGGTGLSLAMTVGAVALLPIGIASAGHALLDPRLLLLGAVVALLSSVVPYSLEMAALRRISPSAFGVLMSLEPAIAALVGWLVLREALELRAIIALVLVTTAAIGATRTDKRAGLTRLPHWSHRCLFPVAHAPCIMAAGSASLSALYRCRACAVWRSRAVAEVVSTFISYSRIDSEFVDRLEADLRARGFKTWVGQKEAGRHTRMAAAD